MKTILIPTDLSPQGHAAIRYAIQLFGREHLEFILFHCASLPQNGTELKLSALNNRPFRESRHKLRSEVSELRRAFPQDNLTFRMVCESGSRMSNLERYVQDNEVDFVVMGTPRSTWLEKVIPGRRAPQQRLAARLTCPILIVPDGATFTTGREINRFQATKDQQAYSH